MNQTTTLFCGKGTKNSDFFHVFFMSPLSFILIECLVSYFHFNQTEATRNSSTWSDGRAISETHVRRKIEGVWTDITDRMLDNTAPTLWAAAGQRFSYFFVDVILSNNFSYADIATNL